MKKLLCILLLFPCVLRAQDCGWVITAGSNDVYHPATVANGNIGVTPGKEPFEIRHIILGDTYRRGNIDAVSRIMQGIVPAALEMHSTNGAIRQNEWSQHIDMLRAVHTTRFVTGDAVVTYSIRALRNMPCAVMVQVDVEARKNTELRFVNRHILPGELTDTVRLDRTVWCENGGRKIQKSAGSFNGGRDHMAAASVIIAGDGCTLEDAGRIVMTLKKGQHAAFTLIGTICTTATFADPWNESELQVIYAVRQGTESLTAEHERQWRDLWRSDITIEGDMQAQQAVRFALFNIYSSIREDSRRSIAPMGLTSQGYNGHLFWDAEMWIFPVLAVMHPELARSMAGYRYDTLAAARTKADAYGYRGAMYPWESDDTGQECTPTFALTGMLEHHITADVAIAAWNLYCVTQNGQWLRSEGWPVISQCARFWQSRATDNGDGSYSIRNVVGADEYAEGVDDNFYTNASARRALEYAVAAAHVCGHQPDPAWLKIAAGLRIHRFSDGVTREYDGYDGRTIKQADVNLGGFPLGVITDTAALMRDMDYYCDRIDPVNGPAMSYSAFAVQYARLGMAEKAAEMFRKSYMPYLRAPFGVFAETASNDEVYFMTGAAGMLQAVIFGFGGIEITDSGIVRGKTLLPDGWKSLEIKGDFCNTGMLTTD